MAKPRLPLNLCPFCGSADVGIQARHVIPWEWFVRCRSCGACGPRVVGRYDEFTIARHWNERKGGTT